MRETDRERVNRYRKAYIDDPRSDEEILLALNSVKAEKKYMDRWIERQVYENQRKESGKTIKLKD